MHKDFPKSIEEGEKCAAELKKNVLAAHARNADVRELKRLNEEYDWINAKVERWLKKGNLQAYECIKGKFAREQQYIYFNDVGAAAVPGEVFTKIGLEIQARIGKDKCFVIGYANGYMAYLPAAEDYPEGSYEVRHSMLEPTAGDVMAETAANLAEAARSLTG